jgi:hypothetical protein
MDTALGCVLDWCTAERPAMFCCQAATRDRGVPLVILDLLCFVKAKVGVRWNITVYSNELTLLEGS